MKKLIYLLLLAASYAPPVSAGPFGVFSELAIADTKNATLPGWEKVILGGSIEGFLKQLSLSGGDNILTVRGLAGGVRLAAVYYSTGDGGFYSLSFDGTQSAFIPNNAKEIFFAVNYPSKIDAVTIGPALTAAESKLIDNGIETKVITGKSGKYGIEASGTDTQVAEISFSHPEMGALTQAYIKLEYKPAELIIHEDEFENFNGESFSGNYTTSYVAVTPQGEIELTPFTPYSDFGSINIEKYMFIPPMTSEVRMKVVFTDMQYLPDEAVKYVAVLTADGYYYGSGELQLCQFIRQDGGISVGSGITNYDMVFGDSPALWYDLDGDGVMEWYAYQRRTGASDRPLLSKFTSDRLGQIIIDPNFGKVDCWSHYGDGNKIGGIYSNTVFSTIMDAGGAVMRTTLSESSGNLTTIDFDNDGHTDFLVLPESSSKLPSEVYTLAADGSLVNRQLKVLTPKEYYNDYDTPTRPGGVVTTQGLGSGVSFVGGGDNKGTTGTFADTQFQIIDLNNDGYPDFVNGNGTYLLNMSNGMFIGGNIGGRVNFRDLNGDGFNDKITYDSSDKSIIVTFQSPDSEEHVSRKLFSGLSCGDRMWCRDFDRDGDVDILVPFNAADNGEQSYLVMFENKGDGTFKRHENFIEEYVEFLDCRDLDADGNYEVLARKGSKYDKKSAIYYNLAGLNVDTAPVELGALSDAWSYYPAVYAADFDNSGETRIIHNEGYYRIPDAGKNTHPQAPGKPTATYNSDNGEVTIEWGFGSDMETAPVDLTYSLRIGTAPGLDDIMWADATADGLRRNLSDGNCGYSRMRKLNSSTWPQGKIYISVQSVDDSGLGSTFSEYAVIEKNAPSVGFTISTDEYFAVDDEALLAMSIAPAAGVTYSWSLDGGIASEQTETGCKVSWKTPGLKTVTLTATTADGATATATEQIKVMRVRLADGGVADALLTLDMDCDGKAEILSFNGSQYHRAAAFYEGDENGEYTKVKRLFNTGLDNYNFGSAMVADVNRDGLPDVIAATQQGAILHLINEDDLSMEIVETEEPFNILVADLNNDGTLDPPHFSGWYHDAYDRYYDYDGDGLVDIFVPDNGILTIYKNLGNFEFSEMKSINDVRAGEFYIGDFNGDGLTDILSTTDGKLRVIWNNGDETIVEGFSGMYFYDIEGCYDFDNNGTVDVLCDMFSSEAWHNLAIIYFNQDHSYDAELIMASNLGVSDAKVLTRTDGYLNLYNYVVKGARTNTPPTAPQGLKVTNNGNTLLAEWQPSTDAESLSAGLKYNISVKRVGGDYLISPLNGGKDGVPVPSTAQLLNSTRYTLPISAVPDGEYEIKVQAVDSRLATSTFSETVKITVKSPSVVYLPEESMVGAPTEVKIKPGILPDVIDFGEDSEVVSTEGNSVYVVWHSEGKKTVKASDYEGKILIHPALNAYVDFPAGIRRFDKVIVSCDNAHTAWWQIYRKNSNITWGDQVDENWYFIDNDFSAVKINAIDDNTTEFIFQNTDYYEMYQWGSVTLRHAVWTEYGSDWADMTVSLDGTSKDAQIIQIMDIDEATGCHALRLTQADRNNVIGYNIYRETSISGDYIQIATLPATQDYYVDNESAPSVKASRYCVEHVLDFGTSAKSLVHQPMHVTINAGLGNSWNLIWSEYEGVEVSTYRILRGTSPTSLQLIDEVSGNMNSYTDYSAPAGNVYYAIEILAEAPVSRAAALRSRSNTVCSSDIASIEEIGSHDEENVQYYDLSGKEVDKPVRGIYIKKLNGKTEKTVIR